MTFEKHLPSVSRSASPRLGEALEKASMTDSFLGDAFWVLSSPFWSIVLPCGARLPIHTLNYLLDLVVNGASFLTCSGCV